MNNTTPSRGFAFYFEEKFDPKATREWMLKNWHFSMYISITYLIIIFGLKRFMEHRQKLELKILLIGWNLIMALFSVMGAIRSAPSYFHDLYQHGFGYTLCSSNFAEDNMVTSFWIWAMACSKIFELGDTLFIVLRKNKLIFLHWYHHVTVLLYTWFHYSYFWGPVRWFSLMNYVVHSIMYSYYFLRAGGFKVHQFIAMAITVTQIFQMVVGLLIIMAAIVTHHVRENCPFNHHCIWWGLIMYISFFVLFVHFFRNSYLGKRKAKAQ